MTDYLRLPVGDESPHVVNAIIEIPRDSVNKYECDVELNVGHVFEAICDAHKNLLDREKKKSA